MTSFDRATERYLTLLDALDQAVIATDVEGRILHWSPAATRLYGWSREEAVGRNIVDVTPAALSQRKANEIMETLRSGAAWSGEFAVRTKDEELFRASVTDIPFVDGNGEIVGFLGVSAPSRTAPGLSVLLTRFVAACDTQWKDGVDLHCAEEGNVAIDASEPHLVQLLSLFVLRHADALEGGSRLEIRAERPREARLASLGAPRSFRGAYLRIARVDDRPQFSVLRDGSRGVIGRDYAPALVRMVGGTVLEGALPNEPRAVHLLLPGHPSAPAS